MSAAGQTLEQSKPAAEIFSDAVAAMSGAKDFHVTGRVTQGKQVVLLNISMSKAGGGGSFQYKGATIELVVNTKYLYLKADAASWKILSGGQAQGQGVAQVLANKWLRVPEGNPEFSSFMNLGFSNKFLPAITQGHDVQRLVKDGLTTYDGRSAVALTDVQHSGKLYVAAANPHYLLGIVSATGTSEGLLQFTDFGDAPMPATPTRAIAFPGL